MIQLSNAHQIGVKRSRSILAGWSKQLSDSMNILMSVLILPVLFIRSAKTSCFLVRNFPFGAPSQRHFRFLRGGGHSRHFGRWQHSGTNHYDKLIPNLGIVSGAEEVAQ